MARPHEFIISLTEKERSYLKNGCKAGKWKPREVLRARILLAADKRNEKGRPFTDAEIADQLCCSKPTITNIRKRFYSENLEVLKDKKRSGRPKLVDGEVEAKMIAVACSEAPEGRERWTLKLIANRLVTLVDDLDSISYTTVGKTLKKTNSNLGSKKSGK